MREEYLTRASLPPSLPSSRSTTPIQRACCGLVSLVYPRRNSTKSRQTCPTLMPPLFSLISLKASGSVALENRRRMSHEDRLKFCQRCSGTIGFLHDKSRIGKIVALSCFSMISARSEGERYEWIIWNFKKILSLPQSQAINLTSRVRIWKKWHVFGARSC